MSVRKIWAAAYILMTEKVVVVFPAIIIGFFELLFLELLYFSSGPPLMRLLNPLIKKLYGDIFIHYPGNMLVLIQFFKQTQTVFYLLFGVVFYAIIIKMVHNFDNGRPNKVKMLASGAFNRYLAFFFYAGLTLAFFAIQNKICGAVLRRIPLFASHPTVSSLSLFAINVVSTTFIVLILPFMVIEKLPLIESIIRGVYWSTRRFLKVFPLILLPYLLYLPMLFLKSSPKALIGKTFPEIIPLLLSVDVVTVLAIETFVIVCASLFVLELKKEEI